MAKSKCGTFIVANYFPGGNYDGQFEDNVPPLDTPAVFRPRNEREKKLYALFEGLDDNGDGLVYVATLEAVLRESGRLQAEIARLKEADVDGNGLLSAQFVSRNAVLESFEDDGVIDSANNDTPRIVGFVKVDKDGSGSLSEAEFLKLLSSTSADHQFTPEVAKELFDLADKNSDGHISYDEMVAFLESGAARRAAADALPEGSMYSQQPKRRFEGIWPPGTDEWLAECPIKSLVDKTKAHVQSGGTAVVTRWSQSSLNTPMGLEP